MHDNGCDARTSDIMYYHFDDQQALIDKLCKEVKPDDIILVKGSRGYKMENVTSALEDNYFKGNNK
jgi:UDP-N-acetylmuramyl pentapeptide synthase